MTLSDGFTTLIGLGGLPAFGVLGGIGLGIVCGLFGMWLHLGPKLRKLQMTYRQVLRESYIFRRVVKSTSDGLLVQKMTGEIIWANPAYCDMMQRPLDEIVGQNPMAFAYPPDQEPTPEEIADFRYDSARGDHRGLHLRRNCRANGDEFWNQISVSFEAAPDGTNHAILSCRDVTEQVDRQTELHTVRKQLEFMVAHDDLTGIANRSGILEFTQKALSDAADHGRLVGMLRVDLDKFKDINDTYGHPAGDAILVHVAQAFRDTLRSTDMVARIGGDEFVVVCQNVRNFDDLTKIANSLGRAAARPIAWGNGTLSITASFGACLSTPGMLAPDDLLQHSDFALYEVKRKCRGGVAAFDEALHQSHSAHMRRREDLARAVARRDLTFHYQPTLNLIDGSISGFESLIRWNHPQDGLLAPNVILPLAAELGLMAELDFAAMEAGLAIKSRLRAAGYPDLRIGLNASGEGLLHPEYVSRLDHMIAIHGFDPGQIAIEVLETVVLDGTEAAETYRQVISDLSKRGFHTMLDDFGIGHAGLAHLANLDLTGVKIDRSLTSKVLEDRTSYRIMRTVIELCDDLDLRLIAEGVETAEVAACLRDMGCAVMQGYWLSRPIPEAEVLPWLQNRVITPLPYGPSGHTEGDTLPAVQKRTAAS